MAKMTGSVLAQGMRGSAGTVVFVTLPSGLTYVRPRVVPRDPRTPAQSESRARMTRANQALQALTPAQVAAWKAFAPLYNAAARPGQRPLPWSMVFTGLAAKWLQVNPRPDASPPADPPSSAAVGDAVTLTVGTSPSGRIVVTADQPNAEGMTTEVLFQPLPSAVRAPAADKYRTAGFVAFAPGSLSAEFDAPGRWVAVAVRFVKVSTGQMTPIMPLSVV